MGPDNIPNWFIKRYANSISQPIKLLFTLEKIVCPVDFLQMRKRILMYTMIPKKRHVNQQSSTSTCTTTVSTSHRKSTLKTIEVCVISSVKLIYEYIIFNRFNCLTRILVMAEFEFHCQFELYLYASARQLLCDN